MATEGILLAVPGLEAAADLTGKQFYAVKIVAPDTVNVCTAVGEYITGVLQDEPAAAGRAANVAVFGRTKAVAGGAIGATDKVMVGSDGRFLTWTTGNHAEGIAIVGAAAADVVFDLLLKPIGVD